MALTQVKTTGIAADAVTGAKVADDQIDSEHYVNASIDHAHLANDCVDGDNIADDAINSEHYVDASIDHQHLADDCVDGDNIADNAVGLAAMAGGTDGVIITYDASGNPVHVGPGSDGQVLTSTGTGSPPAFETLPTSGKILKVAYAASTASQDLGTTYSFTDLTDLSINYTPASASSELHIMADVQTYYRGASSSYYGYMDLQLLHDGTTVNGEAFVEYRNYGSTSSYTMFSGMTHYLGTFNSSNTNARIIKVQAKNENNSTAGLVINQYSGKSFLSVWEVGA